MHIYRLTLLVFECEFGGIVHLLLTNSIAFALAASARESSALSGETHVSNRAVRILL